jgi:hypothetical protein
MGFWQKERSMLFIELVVFLIVMMLAFGLLLCLLGKAFAALDNEKYGRTMIYGFLVVLWLALGFYTAIEIHRSSTNLPITQSDCQ